MDDRRQRLADSSVMSRAVALWRARSYDQVRDCLVDMSGNGLHARLGSAVGADSNDPLRLQYAGETGVYFPGAAGNYMSAPDSAALDIIHDLDIRVKLRVKSWTPAIQQFVSKYGYSDNQRSYDFGFNTNGLYFRLSATGTSLTIDGNATPTIAVGTKCWVRVTYDQDSGAGQYAMSFWESLDGVNWSLLATRTGATIADTFAGTAPLLIGATGNSVNRTDFLDGELYRVQIRNNINDDGTGIVFDADLSKITPTSTSFTEDSSNAATVTINRSASGRKLSVVDRELFLLGTDDYFEVADSPLLNFGAGDSMTVFIALRAYGATATQAFIYKHDQSGGTAAGWLIRRATGTPANLAASCFDGDEQVAASLTSVPVSGQSSGLAFVLNRVSQSVSAALNGALGTGASAATLGSGLNSLPLRIGRVSGAGGDYGDFEFFGAAVFREALSADDLRRLAGEFSVLIAP